MAKPKFRSGDFVRLKSGGPKMTVSDVHQFGTTAYECKWFAGSKQNTEHFAEDELELYPEEAAKGKKVS